MTKSLMLSIRPEHLVNILNGTKTLELRKTVPKDYKGWVYIYCTKGKDILEYSFLGYRTLRESSFYNNGIGVALNCKVVARFWFDEYAELNPNNFFGENVIYYEQYDNKYPDEDIEQSGVIDTKFLEEITQVSLEDMQKYSKGKYIYGWYIKQLEILDEPLALKNFYKHDNKWSVHYKMWERLNHNDLGKYALSRPPQSWQYVYTKENENETKII